MKKFILYTLKRYIPLYAVTFVLFFSTFLTVFSSGTSDYIQVNKDLSTGFAYTVNTGNVETATIAMMVMVLAFTTILPIFANTYRYSLRSADVFGQIGKGKKSIRFVNNAVLFLTFVVSFTVTFLIGVFILMGRQLYNYAQGTIVTTVANPGGVTEITKTPVVYNYGYYFLFYLAMLVVGAINYMISYFFVTRANNLANSILTLIFGHIVLGIGLMTPFWIVNIYMNALQLDTSMLGETIFVGTRTVSPLSISIFFILVFRGFITGSGNYVAGEIARFKPENDTVLLVVMFICFALFIAITVYAFMKFFKEEETSGEFAGKATPRDPYQMIIFHIMAGLAGLWFGILQGITGLRALNIIFIIASTAMYGAVYYVFFGWIRRNFKLTRASDFIIMFTIIGVNLINAIALAIIRITSGL